MSQSEALDNAGLTGWKVSFHSHAEVNGRRACVLTSPDYNPVKQTGRMIVRTATSDAEAFALSLKTAKEAVYGQVQ